MQNCEEVDCIKQELVEKKERLNSLSSLKDYHSFLVETKKTLIQIQEKRIREHKQAIVQEIVDLLTQLHQEIEQYKSKLETSSDLLSAFIVVSEIDWMEVRRKKAESLYTSIQQTEEDDLIQKKEEKNIQ